MAKKSTFKYAFKNVEMVGNLRLVYHVLVYTDHKVVSLMSAKIA